MFSDGGGRKSPQRFATYVSPHQDRALPPHVPRLLSFSKSERDTGFSAAGIAKVPTRGQVLHDDLVNADPSAAESNAGAANRVSANSLRAREEARIQEQLRMKYGPKCVFGTAPRNTDPASTSPKWCSEDAEYDASHLWTIGSAARSPSRHRSPGGGTTRAGRDGDRPVTQRGSRPSDNTPTFPSLVAPPAEVAAGISTSGSKRRAREAATHRTAWRARAKKQQSATPNAVLSTPTAAAKQQPSLPLPPPPRQRSPPGALSARSVPPAAMVTPGSTATAPPPLGFGQRTPRFGQDHPQPASMHEALDPNYGAVERHVQGPFLKHKARPPQLSRESNKTVGPGRSLVTQFAPRVQTVQTVRGFYNMRIV